MGFTNFPHGVTSFGIPLYGGSGPFGLGCGKIWYVVSAKTSSDAYYSLLNENGVDEGSIFTSISSAYTAATENRNDVIAIFPGTYTVTSSLTWAKDRTHIVGLGGPNQRHITTAGDDGNVKIYCATAAIDSILSITGKYVEIYGIQTQNTYSDNGNRCDIEIKSKNTYLQDCFLRGGTGANQVNHADGGVPMIVASGTAGAGNGLTAVNCTFGSSGNSARTVGVGGVLFEGGAAAGFCPKFYNCTFEMRCETSGSSNPKLIHLASNYAVDRYLLFDNCFFYSFYENMAAQVDYAIVDACATTHSIVLKNCAMQGIDAWCNVATYCFSSIANAASDGGIATAVDTTP